MYLFFCLGVGSGAWKVWWVLVPPPPLFAGPSPSKHLGGLGLVVAAHRVVMDTLRVQLRLLVGPPFFLGTIPQAHLLLMSLNVAKCNLG